jgi:hypothetical protein
MRETPHLFAFEIRSTRGVKSRELSAPQETSEVERVKIGLILV